MQDWRGLGSGSSCCQWKPGISWKTVGEESRPMTNTLRLPRRGWMRREQVVGQFGCQTKTSSGDDLKTISLLTRFHRACERYCAGCRGQKGHQWYPRSQPYMLKYWSAKQAVPTAALVVWKWRGNSQLLLDWLWGLIHREEFRAGAVNLLKIPWLGQS